MKTSDLLLLAGAGYLIYKLIPEQTPEDIISGGGGISIDLGGLSDFIPDITQPSDSGVTGALSGLSNTLGAVTSFLGGGGLTSTIKETIEGSGVLTVDTAKDIISGLLPVDILTLADAKEVFGNLIGEVDLGEVVNAGKNIVTEVVTPEPVKQALSTWDKIGQNMSTGLQFVFGGAGELAYEKSPGWVKNLFTPESAKPSDYAYEVLAEEAFRKLGVTEVSTPEDLYRGLSQYPELQTQPYVEAVDEYEGALPPTIDEAGNKYSSAPKPPKFPVAVVNTDTGAARPPTEKEATERKEKQIAEQNILYGDIHAKYYG